ncbi:MAG: hypothetical protein ABJA62_07590 [Luteimonas sp.]
MKRIFIVMAALAFDANAQGGVYEPVPRSDDPFVFCTQGTLVDDGWKPIDPVTGTFVITNQYGPWLWLSTYVRVCPRALGRGAWTGAQPSDMVPFKH